MSTVSPPPPPTTTDRRPWRQNTVFLLHGVSSTGAWFERADRVLEPHFKCSKLRYHDYEKFGRLKVFLAPWPAASSGAIVFAFVAAVLAFVGHGAVSAARGAAPFGVAALLAGGIAGAWNLRRAAAKAIATACDQARPSGIRTHLLAHSFGSYLAGQLLHRFNQEFGRICFAASVLPRKLDWKRFVLSLRPGVRSVRNDVSRRDLTVSIGGLLPHLGWSGTHGFNERAGVVHSAVPTGCEKCLAGQTVPVHNVRFNFEHSDHFVGYYHLAAEYLPFFFAIDPTEYRDFIEWCRAGAKAVRQNDWLAIQTIDRRFIQRRWRWAAGSLNQYITRQLHAQSARAVIIVDPEVLARTRLRTWMAVDEACAARDDRGRDHVVLAMLPRIAVVRALLE